MSGDAPKQGPEAAEAPLAIGRELLLAIYRQARKAFPAECCGWITGAKEGSEVSDIRPCANAQASGDHPDGRGRTPDQAYVIAGDDLIAFNRAFDQPNPPRAIYHSHPNGKAYFSDMDQDVAKSPWGDGPAYPVQQLVVGLTEGQIDEAALFAWSDEAQGFVEVARFPGASDI